MSILYRCLCRRYSSSGRVSQEEYVSDRVARKSRDSHKPLDMVWLGGAITPTAPCKNDDACVRDWQRKRWAGEVPCETHVFIKSPPAWRDPCVMYESKYSVHGILSLFYSGETGIGKSTLMDSLFKASFQGE